MDVSFMFGGIYGESNCTNIVKYVAPAAIIWNNPKNVWNFHEISIQKYCVLTENKSVQLNTNKPQVATGYRCCICRDIWAACLENKNKIKYISMQYSVKWKYYIRTDADTSASLQWLIMLWSILDVFLPYSMKKTTNFYMQIIIFVNVYLSNYFSSD